MKDTALIVVDMLYDFIDGSMACLEALQAMQAEGIALRKLQFWENLIILRKISQRKFSQYGESV